MHSSKKILSENNQNIFKDKDGAIVIELSSHDFEAIIDEGGFLTLRLFNQDSKLYKAVEQINPQKI